LHIIKLEPYSLDDEKIKKKRERRKDGLEERKRKNGPWPWVVGRGSGPDPQLAKLATYGVGNLSQALVSGF
jgi:hypothetical protein